MATLLIFVFAIYFYLWGKFPHEVGQTAGKGNNRMDYPGMHEIGSWMESLEAFYSSRDVLFRN